MNVKKNFENKKKSNFQISTVIICNSKIVTVYNGVDTTINIRVKDYSLCVFTMINVIIYQFRRNLYHTHIKFKNVTVKI